MAEQASTEPQDIRVTTLGGLNERVSPANLRPGEFSVLEGMYPSQVGLQSRIPGKVALSTLLNGTNILQICQTFNQNGDILVQTDSGRVAYTLDELLGRSPTPPNLTPGTTPSTNVEEESMSMALIVQSESFASFSGSVDGWVSAGSTASASTFYPRRLTAMLVNESSTVVTFTASTGGAGAPSTLGTFQLAPAVYRISADFTFGVVTTASNLAAIIGLYNTTTSLFQVHTGTSIPIMATAVFNTVGSTNNVIAHMEGQFTVTGSNNTFQIQQEAGTTTQGRSINFGGFPTGITAANVNGSAVNPTYALVKILKEP